MPEVKGGENPVEELRQEDEENRERKEALLTNDRLFEARGGDVPEVELRSEESMKEEEKPVTEGEEERVLEINRISGSLIRKEAINRVIKVSQAVRTKVVKIRSQKEVVKKLPDEEDRKS